MKDWITTIVLTNALFFIFTCVGATAGVVDYDECSARPLRADVKDGGCELELFTNFVSSVQHGSGTESDLNRRILQFVRDNQDRWNGRLDIKEDDIGNTYIYVPGTGSYTNSQSVALEAHKDMILAVRDAPAGSDLVQYFQNVPIEFETVGDPQGVNWLQSVNNKTTIGADDGIGVAIALRYVIDPKIPHPPLEIFLTVQEEFGMVGAASLGFPIRSKFLINLDGEGGPQIWTGCQSGKSGLVHANLNVISTHENLKYFKLEAVNLRGGHSSAEIEAPRMNGILGLAELIEALKGQHPNLVLVKAKVGFPEFVNVIPNAFTAVIGIPQDDPQFAGFTGEAASLFESIRSLYSDDNDSNNRDLKFTVSKLALDRSVGNEVPNYALAGDDLTAFLMNISQTPNNVLQDPSGQTNGKPISNGPRTTSNLGYFVFDADNPEADLAYLTRSADNSFLENFFGVIENSIALAFGNNQNSDVISAWPVWPNAADSKLVTLAEKSYFTSATAIGGGLETSVFADKYDDLSMISVGPVIQNPHTRFEELSIDSVVPTAKGVADLLVAIVENQDEAATQPGPYSPIFR